MKDNPYAPKRLDRYVGACSKLGCLNLAEYKTIKGDYLCEEHEEKRAAMNAKQLADMEYRLRRRHEAEDRKKAMPAILARARATIARLNRSGY